MDFCKIILLANLFLSIFFSLPVHAGCNLAESTITLKTRKTPIKDILKQIEKQIPYTIQSDNPSILQNKKSILLKQTPLDLALSRILKDINFSLVCNEEKKTLRLVLFDKQRGGGGEKASSGSGSALNMGMAALESAEADYNSGHRVTTLKTGVDHPMMALEAAEEDYESGHRTSLPKVVAHHPMMALDAAEEDYESGHRTSPPRVVAHHPMMALDAAEKDYESGHRAEVENQAVDHPMMALEAAEQDYLTKKENRALGNR
jgi:hypothetical protein